jgi:hypothetical protein
MEKNPCVGLGFSFGLPASQDCAAHPAVGTARWRLLHAEPTNQGAQLTSPSAPTPTGDRRMGPGCQLLPL